MSWMIRAENLSKCYRIRHADKWLPYRTLREDLMRMVAAPWRRLRGLGDGDVEEFWALKDVSFEVNRGEVLGIIGRNGAGKSTLLKILSRITRPTSGTARIRGRIGSLLEVGTGFHPELTGRENIYLSGAILGMTRGEVKRKFDEIVDFAGIETFLDTPAKRYSSGMYVRLAFAVAAHLDPELLLIDEVLAVGDTNFRRKCLGKMGSIAHEGRTVLLVSHDMQAITSLANRCVVLSAGRCSYAGPPSEAISKCLDDMSDEGSLYRSPADATRPKITRVEVKTSAPASTQYNGEELQILVEIAAPTAVDGASVSVQVIDELNQPILQVWGFDSEHPVCREAGRFELQFTIPKLRLYRGHYALTVHFSERPGGTKFETIERICPFEVAIRGRMRDWGWNPGTEMYLEDYTWIVNRIGTQLDSAQAPRS